MPRPKCDRRIEVTQSWIYQVFTHGLFCAKPVIDLCQDIAEIQFESLKDKRNIAKKL